MNEQINSDETKEVPEAVDVANLFDAEINILNQQNEQLGSPSVDQGQEATNQETSQTSPKGPTEKTYEVADKDGNFSTITKPEGHALSRKEHRMWMQAKVLKGEKITFADTFSHNRADLRNPFNWANIPAAMGAGYTDFWVDLLNAIPGNHYKPPKLPKYESATLQTIRQLSSIIIPVMNISNAWKSFGKSTHAKVKWGLGDKKFMRWFGSAGIDAGAGAFVDQITEFNEFEDNAAGALKKMWPQTYGWIPDDIATLDSDAPEIKRLKNVQEGVGLSFASDFILGGTRILRALNNSEEALQWFPKSEEAKKFAKKLRNVKKKPIDTELKVIDERRQKEFVDIGKNNAKELGIDITGDVDLDQPIKGVHDVYDMYETGFRTQDQGGIIPVQFDLVRITNNIDSVDGDVGSIFTDSSLKAAIKSKDGGHMTIKELVKQIKLDFEWHSPKGIKITHAEATEIGEDIASALYDFDNVDQMKRLLDEFSGVDPDTGAKVLKTEGYTGVTKAISKFFDDYMNMDLARAQAYVSESLADTAVGMAEGMRMMDGTSAVEHAQLQILDRLQYLMTIKGQTAYARGRALNMLNFWNRLNPMTKKFGKRLDFTNYGGKAKVMENAYKFLKENNDDTLKMFDSIAKDSKDSIDTIRALSKEKPNMLKPLFLAYEFTDGNVNNIAKLNKYFKESTGVFKKALIDLDGEFESLFMQGVWGNIYNSVLSAVGTPLKAFASNMALMIERPIATYAGAILSRDMHTIRKANYMYFSGIGETSQRAFDHFKLVFKKAWKDPSSVGYITRSDIAMKNEGQIQALRAIADVAEEEGNFGPAALVNKIEEMNDIANHPWLRYGANSMTAMDGFTRAWIGSVEAKGRAFDTIVGKGQKLTKQKVEALQKKVYKDMFDDEGMITDKGVEYASKEIAMNLDNQMVDSLNMLIKKVPALRPFLMFPKTATNMISFTATHSPLGLFIKEFDEYHRPFNMLADSDVDALLTKRGIDPSKVNKEAAYNTIRAELKGRRAIGMATMGLAATMFTSDRLHGNGIYDPTRQRLRTQLGWKPRSYKGWDGKWYSYEGLGAISDWIAITADVMDNFDIPFIGHHLPGNHQGTLDENSLEVNMAKMAWVLGANLTNKSFLAGLEPMFDVLQGNPKAISRWTASFGSGLLPYSGLRNEFSRLLTPQLKEVEMEFTDLFWNRNPVLKSTLPNSYDWMDGGLIREPDNFFVRAWNAYSPVFKVGSEISPEKDFLMMVEFDGRPQLNKSGSGVEYTTQERSQVTELMGKDGIFKKKVNEIMNSRLGKEFRKAYKEASKTGAEVDRELFTLLHTKINDALRKSQLYAEKRIQLRGQVKKKIVLNDRIEKAHKKGDIDEILRLQKLQSRY